MQKKRKERDFLGSINVPADKYYGSFTARALENFNISGIQAPQTFKRAIGLIKKAAANANLELHEIEEKHANSIIKASEEFINGKFDDQFNLDVFQAGAGTPFNMNANEIIANRANEILGGKKGKYSPITPNNHVNWGQSSNDVIPTAIRIAALIELKTMLPKVESLTKSFKKKGRQFNNILKIGRTHMQDAVPITLGQEFNAYANSLNKSAKYIKESFSKLNEVQIGGTAVGTGITSHPRFKTVIVKYLNKYTGLKLKNTKDAMEMNANMNTFVLASNSLKLLANNLVRISNDLVLLNSGPKGGLNEISLPEVEPGSSIMPGKVNPSIAECVSMSGFQIIGNDLTINTAAQHAMLELNVMTPVIMYNLLWSMKLIRATCEMFKKKCIDHIKVNNSYCQESLDNSLCLATGLSPYLGYPVTAMLVKEALNKKQTLYDTVAGKKFMKEPELKKILSAKKLTSTHISDKALINRIKTNKNYQKYLNKT